MFCSPATVIKRRDIVVAYLHGKRAETAWIWIRRFSLVSSAVRKKRCRLLEALTRVQKSCQFLAPALFRNLIGIQHAAVRLRLHALRIACLPWPHRSTRCCRQYFGYYNVKSALLGPTFVFFPQPPSPRRRSSQSGLLTLSPTKKIKKESFPWYAPDYSMLFKLAQSSTQDTKC